MGKNLAKRELITYLWRFHGHFQLFANKIVIVTIRVIQCLIKFARVSSNSFETTACKHSTKSILAKNFQKLEPDQRNMQHTMKLFMLDGNCICILRFSNIPETCETNIAKNIPETLANNRKLENGNHRAVEGSAEFPINRATADEKDCIGCLYLQDSSIALKFSFDPLFQSPDLLLYPSSNCLKLLHDFIGYLAFLAWFLEFHRESLMLNYFPDAMLLLQVVIRISVQFGGFSEQHQGNSS